MTEQKFKKGDVVALKSGGPKMCVEYEASVSDSRASLVWFDESKVYRADFDEALLMKVTPEQYQ